MDYISTIITALISSIGTGSITYWVTFNSARKKASAEADSAELNNVQVAIKIWREMAEDMAAQLNDMRLKYDGLMKQYEGVLAQVGELKASIDKLNASNSRILAMLNKMKPDNFQSMISEIKKELDHARK